MSDDATETPFSVAYKQQIYHLFVGVSRMTEAEMRAARRIDYLKVSELPSADLIDISTMYRLKWVGHAFEVFDEDYFAQVKRECDFFLKETGIDRRRVRIYCNKKWQKKLITISV